MINLSSAEIFHKENENLWKLPDFSFVRSFVSLCDVWSLEFPYFDKKIVILSKIFQLNNLSRRMIIKITIWSTYNNFFRWVQGPYVSPNGYTLSPGENNFLFGPSLLTRCDAYIYTYILMYLYINSQYMKCNVVFWLGI